MSQYVLQSKEPSLHNGHHPCVSSIGQNLKPCTANGDIFIKVGQSTPSKQADSH